MRIGLIAPPWLPVPPPAYGGTESVVANLALGLAALGHDVKLFTVGESTCAVPRRYAYERSVTPIGAGAPEAVHVLAAYAELEDVDVIHDHTVLGPLIAGRRGLAHRPVVVTHHGLFDPVAVRLFTEIARTASVVAISRDQASRARGVPIAAVVHHGVDTAAYRPSGSVGEHLVFIGRMSPVKGVHHAVRIARAAGRPLRIVTKMREAEEFAYYENAVKPLLRAGDDVPTELPLAERIDILRSASGLLNPIAWAEPFGLVMAEALAAGTPVVASPLGAAPEIVSDGRTGFLPVDEADAVSAIGRLGDIDRALCRRDAEERFSVERMARNYLEIYERAITNAGADGRSLPPS